MVLHRYLKTRKLAVIFINLKLMCTAILLINIYNSQIFRSFIIYGS